MQFGKERTAYDSLKNVIRNFLYFLFASYLLSYNLPKWFIQLIKMILLKIVETLKSFCFAKNKYSNYSIKILYKTFLSKNCSYM